MTHKVFISKIEDKLNEKLREAMEWVEWERFVKPNCRVFIKPNLVSPEYKIGVTTSPPILDSLVQILKLQTNNIIIGESDGSLNAWTADEAFEGHGLLRLEKEHGVKLINLSREEPKYINVKKIKIPLPKLLLEEIDVLINVPVLKTHLITGITLGFKNLWGCIPDAKRLIYHHIFDEAVVAIAKAMPPQIVIIDGLYGLDKKGPNYGEVVRMDTLIVANSIGAADFIGCRIMNMDPWKVGHLRVAKREGMIPSFEEIMLNDDISNFNTHKFTLERDITDWVAFWAFKSRFLTELIFLSPIAPIKRKIARIFKKEYYRTPF